MSTVQRMIVSRKDVNFVYRLVGHEPLSPRVYRHFTTTLHFKFHEHGRDVVLYGFLGKNQLACYVLVSKSTADETDNLKLSRR